MYKLGFFAKEKTNFFSCHMNKYNEIDLHFEHFEENIKVHQHPYELSRLFVDQHFSHI